MFYKNLTLYRYTTAMASRIVADLATGLDGARLRECGPLELQTVGFVSPFGREADALTHVAAGFIGICLGANERILPSRVLKRDVARRVKAIIDKEGRRVSARERKRIKEGATTDLLARAFVDEKETRAYFDPADGWLVVDASSHSAADDLVVQVREALGSFSAVPMSPEESPRTLMTDWVVHGRLPPGWTLGDEIELRDPADGGAVVRCRKQDLDTDEVRKHLESGKQVFQLALNFDDRISFVLGADLAVRKLRFLDGVLDELSETERDSAAAELDAQFALMTLELRRFLARLAEIFGVRRPMDQVSAPASDDVGDDMLSDPGFATACRDVMDYKIVSISRVQRILGIGYNHAARMIERMEEIGLVSPPDNAGRRSVVDRATLRAAKDFVDMLRANDATLSVVVDGETIAEVE